MGIIDFVRFKKQEIENNISTNEIKRLKELFYASNPYDVKEITLLFQKIENKKAQKEKRTPATIKIEITAGSEMISDRYDENINEITIHFPNRNEFEQIYASYIHESRHAYQDSLKSRDISQLSEFDKNVTIAHKIAECYNINDDNDELTIQYLYNYSELDSKVEEIKALIDVLKTDIEKANLYKQGLLSTIQNLQIYNKKEFKQYQQWQLKHYNAYKNQPENDYMYITPQIKKLEENLNINIYDFLKNTQPDLSYAKFNELIILRTELTKLYNIMLKYDKDPEKRTQLLNKHLNNKDTKIENQDKDNVNMER